MKTNDMIREVKNIDMFVLLQDHGITINKRGQALCVFHQETNPSMAVYPSKVKCFHEGDVEDVIAVYMAINNMGRSQFKQAVAELYDRYITNIATVKPYVPTPAMEQGVPSTADKNKKHKRKNTLKQADKDFVPFEDLDEFDQARVNEYFRQRGIPSAVSDLKSCGYDIGLDRFFKIDNYMHNLMYKLNGFYVKRGMHSSFKGNAGTSQVTKLNKYKGSRDWIVVEGITDALSILELNRENGMEYNVISLNSSSNVNKFIKSVEPEGVKKSSFKFFTLLDQDDPGEKATEKLISFFAGQGIEHERMTILDNTEHNDINTLLAHTKEQRYQERCRNIGLESGGQHELTDK